MQARSSLKEPSRPLDLRGTGYCICFNSRKVARAVTQLYDTILQPWGIRATQFTLLVGIAKLEPVSIGRLGEVTIIDRTTLTRSLRLMRNQKLLLISPRSAMRQRFVTLSRRGRRALARSVRPWRKIQSEFLGTIGHGRWRSMQREMERIAGIALHLDASKRRTRKRA